MDVPAAKKTLYGRPTIGAASKKVWMHTRRTNEHHKYGTNDIGPALLSMSTIVQANPHTVVDNERIHAHTQATVWQ
jgi:hypothetical protein